ncbi:MAG: hypothetical protein HQM01_03140 [Magnetococcales bacterium]|nr:hypothetical protein [Magnetococcales bacterium]
MSQIILFGGGDAGGLIIGPNGVRPIPPFDPAIRLQLRGISALLAGARHMSDKPSKEMGTLINKMTNLVIEQVEAIVGQLGGSNAFVYQDEDGGFTCGSTGKPPLPFPWPPLKFPNVNDLIASGVLERDLLDIVAAATEKNIDILELLENPAEEAQKVGMRLSSRAATDLKRLAPSQLGRISDPVDKEILAFLHAVVKDGRFLSTWSTRPGEVADTLKIKISDQAFEKILAGGASTLFDPGTVMNPVALAVVVGIVIMLVPTEAGRGRFDVRDFSGINKF